MFFPSVNDDQVSESEWVCMCMCVCGIGGRKGISWMERDEKICKWDNFRTSDGYPGAKKKKEILMWVMLLHTRERWISEGKAAASKRRRRRKRKKKYHSRPAVVEGTSTSKFVCCYWSPFVIS